MRTFRLGLILLTLSAADAPASQIVSTWVGGDGSYTDPASWSFAEPPALATYPSNDEFDSFDVRIDGGNDAAASQVSLDTQVVIDALHVDAGDALSLVAGGTLQLATPASPLRNDGVIQLQSGALAAELLVGTTGSTSLETIGTGVIELSDHGGNRIANADPGRSLFLQNGVGHTIRGAGLLDLSNSSLFNDGALEATGSNPLRIEGGLLNRGEVRVTGVGGLEVTGNLDNPGLLEVSSGGRLVAEAFLDNDGVLRIAGNGSSADIQNLAGPIEILDGASAEATFYRGDARIAGGAEFRVLSSSQGGVFELDDGTLSSPGFFRAGGVSGNGSVLLDDPDAELRLRSPGTIAPGLGGPGRIDVGGRLTLEPGRIFEAEIAGADEASVDRLAVTGAVTFDPESLVSVSLLGGFEPAFGDAFVLLSGSSISTPANLAPLFDVPGLAAPDLFFLPRVDRSLAPALESLELRIVRAIEASWNGGAGSYEAPGRWTFSSPPATALFPANDTSNLFDLRVDSPGSVASLSTQVAVDSVRIGAGGELAVADGASLLLSTTLNRPVSGAITNDGILRLGTGGSGAELLTNGDLRIGGLGTLDMGDDPGNRIANTGPFVMQLVHDAGHTLRGAGEIFLDRGTLLNRGTIDATGSNPLRIESFVENEGVLRASGAGGLLVDPPSTSQIENRGLIEIGPGSVIDTAIRHDSDDAVTRVLAGGTLRLGSRDFSRGRLELRDGVVSSSAFGLSITGSALLTGSGELLFDPLGAKLEIESGGRIAPGIDGPGRFDLTDHFALITGGSWDVDLGGTDPAAFDRVVVTGSTAAIWQNSSFRVSLLDGFLPAAGDVFEILTASSISTPPRLETHFEMPSVADDVFLMPRVAERAGDAGLQLAALQVVEADWNGGSGSWTGAGGWSFSQPPVSAGFPHNDDFNLFDVRIDAPGASQVLLTSDVQLDNLFVGTGDTLTLNSGAELVFGFTPARAPNRTLTNDGTIDLPAGVIRSEHDLSIEGTGTIDLGNNTNDRINAAGGYTIDLTHGAGHTMRGTGFIDLGGRAATLRNQGTLVASGNHFLRIEASVENDGVMRATGSANLVVFHPILNRGLVETQSSGRLTTTLPFENEGTLRIGGSARSTLDDIDQRGLVEVLGGVLEVAGDYVHDLPSSITRIANGGRIELNGGRSFEQGRLELDGGTLQAGSLQVGLNGVLEGSGSILLPSTTSRFRVLGALGGAGPIDVTGEFELFGSWDLQIAGATEFGRVASMGDVFIDSDSSIQVSPLAGFRPSRGTVFEILSAPRIVAPGRIDSVMTLPDLGPDLFLVPRRAGVTGAETVELRALELVHASWAGGPGGYGDSASWSFDRPPAARDVPDNDDFNIFQVDVSAGQSSVVLPSAVTVDGLAIGSDDELTVEGGILGLSFTPGRADAGLIVNDGTLRVGTTLQGGELRAEADLRLGGSGVLELSEAGRISTRTPARGDVINGSGHTLRGSGTIVPDGGTLGGFVRNEGTLEANAPTPLTIEGQLDNTGTTRATGAGGLEVTGPTMNRGLLEVGADSSLRLTVPGRGQYTQDGVNSLTRVDEDAVMDVTSFRQNQGRTELRGGSILGHFTIAVFGGLLEGNGQLIVEPQSTVDFAFGGSLAPGLDGAGRIDVDGILRVLDESELRIELGGTERETGYDFVKVMGAFGMTGDVVVELIDPDPGDADPSLFAPGRGDIFDILEAETITLLGVDFLLPELEEGLSWIQSIVSTGSTEKLRLGVVPEPHTGLLTAAGLALLAWRQRHRTRASGRS